MLCLSKTKGTGGTVKSVPEDFIVREITSKGITLELQRAYSQNDLNEEEAKDGKFCSFILEKKNWNTINALLTIAKRLGHGRKAIGYSGIKDRNAMTVQLASIFGAEPEAVMRIRIKDLSINGAWKSDGVEMGSNLGNAFSIRVRDAEETDPSDTISELSYRFPNYFDSQRFGTRLNNAAIGICLMEGRFEDAVMEFLTGTEHETSADAIEARKRLKEEQDFMDALSYFPRYLKAERTVIHALSKERNYANAMRTIPRGISLLFIHAVESYIFNAELELRIKANDLLPTLFLGRNEFGFPDAKRISDEGFPAAPLIGYKTDERYMSSYSEEVMAGLGMSKESFMIKSMPELSMKGDIRAMLAPFKDFSFNEDKSVKGIFLNFSLPSGSYATIFINEITKSSDFQISSIKTR